MGRSSKSRTTTSASRRSTHKRAPGNGEQTANTKKAKVSADSRSGADSRSDSSAATNRPHKSPTKLLPVIETMADAKRVEESRGGKRTYLQLTDEEVDKEVTVALGIDMSIQGGTDLDAGQYRTYIRQLMDRKRRLTKELNKKMKVEKDSIKQEDTEKMTLKMDIEVNRIIAEAQKTKWVMYPTLVICKAQKSSFLNAGVDHTSPFAKFVIKEFLKNDWPEQEKWCKRRLWEGDLKVYQLGRKALAALKCGRNFFIRRVLKTTGTVPTAAIYIYYIIYTNLAHQFCN